MWLESRIAVETLQGSHTIKTLFVLALVVAFAPRTWAKVWATAYRCDETTPLDAVDPNHPAICRDIMVGTRLVIVVKSDSSGIFGDHLLWSGGCGFRGTTGNAAR
jgi:hypothetical protein